MTSYIGPGYAGAIFGGPSSEYRYSLWRRFTSRDVAPARMIAFIGLNPSTADEKKNDPTVERCVRRAGRLGFGGMLMMNAYAFRSTDPAGLKATADPLGPDNLTALADVCRQVDTVVACWGVHCSEAHEWLICRMIGRPIHCLGRTKDGRPRHPLYLRNDQPLEVFWRPRGGDA